MNEQTGRLVIFGCGGHSRSVADVFLTDNRDAELVFVDSKARNMEQLFGFPVYNEYQLRNELFFIAIGNNYARKEMLDELGDQNLISIISRAALLSQHSILGQGCFIGHFCHIGPEAVIGRNTILNTASVIEHEVRIGAHCHIGPNTTISGRCNIGNLVFIGVGATVRDRISICDNVMVGAGSTVVKDIRVPGTYIGTPARMIK